MSQEAVVRFWMAAESDHELQKSIENLKTEREFVALAKTKGYEFTPTEMKSVEEKVNAVADSSEAELSDDELQAVAGGVSFSTFRALMKRSFGRFDPAASFPCGEW